MKTVLVLIYTPTFGGPHNQVLRLSANLESKGWKTMVVLPSESGDGFQRLDSAGIVVKKIKLSRFRSRRIILNLKYFLFFFKEVRSIKRIISDNNIDVVQICGLMHIHGAIAARSLGVPVVWQLLSTFAPKYIRAIYTPLVALMSRFVMSTGSIIIQKHPFSFLFRNKLIPFYPPVDTTKFVPNETKRKRGREKLNLPANAFVIGTIGNQNRQKSHDQFVIISKILTDEFPDIRCRIVGKETDSQRSYYKKEVINLAADKELYENGKFDIVDSDLSSDVVLSAFDVFVITSFAEGVPTVILEAMSIGLPIVSTSVGSIPEIVIEGKNGFLYDFGDSSMAIEKIKYLFKNRKNYQEISENNRKDAVAIFDTSICLQSHFSTYENCLKN